MHSNFRPHGFATISADKILCTVLQSLTLWVLNRNRDVVLGRPEIQDLVTEQDTSGISFLCELA